MATSAELLVDTSVAVALIVADHEHHAATTAAVGTRSVGLSGHAAFETFSVLTRMPPPNRRPPAVVAGILRQDFPHSRFLGSRRAARLIDDLAGQGIAGGSIYDALVGAAAAEAGLPLATRDRRALNTYRLIGVNVELLA